LKKSGEIRIEPPVPMEPIIKSDGEVNQEKVIKVDNGNTISKDAIKKEDEELEKRPELHILENLKSHENEEKKILAETKKILEELKGAHQMQFEKNKIKSMKPILNRNSSIDKQEDRKTITEEKRRQIEGAIKDKLPVL